MHTISNQNVLSLSKHVDIFQKHHHDVFFNLDFSKQFHLDKDNNVNV